MNGSKETRNIDTIRNVVLDELVTELALELADGEELIHLNDVILGDSRLLKVLRRLEISVPRGTKVAGLVVQRAYWMAHDPEQHPAGDFAPGHRTEGMVNPSENAH